MNSKKTSKKKVRSLSGRILRSGLNCYNSFLRMLSRLRMKMTYVHAEHFIKGNLKKLKDRKKLTREQKNEIQSFYKSIKIK